MSPLWVLVLLTSLSVKNHLLLGLVGVSTAQWYPPANPGNAPALTDEEREAGKYYAWNESNYQSDPATAWVLTTPE